jgi:hypothetical protein
VGTRESGCTHLSVGLPRRDEREQRDDRARGAQRRPDGLNARQQRRRRDATPDQRPHLRRASRKAQRVAPTDMCGAARRLVAGATAAESSIGTRVLRS